MLQRFPFWVYCQSLKPPLKEVYDEQNTFKMPLCLEKCVECEIHF